MHQLEIAYLQDLRTQSLHIKSNKMVITDAPVDNHGKGEAHSPTDLLCSALGSCMLTIMGIEAQKINIVLDGTSATIEKVMQATPRRVSAVKIHIQLKTNKALTKDEFEHLKQSAISCPVALSLNAQLRQEVTFVLSE